MGYFLEWKIITCFISKSKTYDYLYNKYFRLATIFFREEVLQINRNHYLCWSFFL